MQQMQPLRVLSTTSQHRLLVALLVLPWVHRFAPGPVSDLVPWLISWAALALAMMHWRHLSASVVAQSWAIAALLSSLIGLVQFFGFADTFASVMHVPTYSGDAFGNLRQRNQQATLLTMGMFAVLAWYAWGLPRKHALWMLVVLAWGLAATASRTGLLQALFLVFWMVLHRRGPAGTSTWMLSAASLVMYLLASMILPQLLGHWTGQVAGSALTRMVNLDGCGERQILWSNVLHLIAQKPWTGWGWDELRYAHYITAYPGPRFCDTLGNAHNLPLHLAFVWGVPVALMVFVCLAWLVWRARPWRHAGTEKQLAWGVLGVIALHSMLEYPLWYGPFQVAVVLALWLLGGRMALAVRNATWPRPTAVVILALLAFVAFDYAQVRQIYLPAHQRWHVWRDNPLDAAQRSWFFPGTALFAEVTTTRLSQDNARWLLEASQRALHTAPEARVIEKLLESARWLQEEDVFNLHQARYQAVDPEKFQAWSRSQR